MEPFHFICETGGKNNLTARRKRMLMASKRPPILAAFSLIVATFTTWIVCFFSKRFTMGRSVCEYEVIADIFALALFLIIPAGLVEGNLFQEYSIPYFILHPSTENLKQFFSQTYPFARPEIADPAFRP